MSAERWHFPKQSPASLGIDSAGVERFLDALENEHIDIHSFLMIRHGKLAVEGLALCMREISKLKKVIGHMSAPMQTKKMWKSF